MFPSRDVKSRHTSVAGIPRSRRSVIGASLFLVLAFGCVSKARADQPIAHCVPLPGWDALLSKEEEPAKYVVFGEVHGTQEVPAAVGQYVCAAGSVKSPLLLAVEFPNVFNAQLQTAWASSDNFKKILLGALPSAYPLGVDGAISEAVIEMLSYVRDLRKLGIDIDVVGFAGPKGSEQTEKFQALPMQEQFEAFQAENIREGASKRAYGQVVVLVGNLHARKNVSVGPSYETMAMKLAPPKQVISLDVRYSGGTAYNCQLPRNQTPSAGPIDLSAMVCGPKSIGTRATATTIPQIKLEFSEGAFDGYFHVGTVSASTPPVRDGKGARSP